MIVIMIYCGAKLYLTCLYSSYLNDQIYIISLARKTPHNGEPLRIITC
jgi:hypothetical protein